MRNDLFSLKMEQPTRKNFSEFEKELLLTEVELKKDIIENKLTNAVTNSKKAGAWKEIAHKFNSTPGVTKRTPYQLQCFYKNLKRRAMQKKTKSKVQIYKNGGGSFTCILDHTEERLLEMEVMKQPLENISDDDHTFHASTSYLDMIDSHSENEEIIGTQDSVTEDSELPVETKTLTSRWRMTKKKKRTPLTTTDAMAIAKEKVAAEQLIMQNVADMEQKKKEHEARMEQLLLNMRIQKEEHQAKMKQIFLTMKMQKEEHEARMEQLRLSIKIQKDEHNMT